MDSKVKWKRGSNASKDNEVHRVLVLQGGGAFGAYEVGVFDVLYY